MLARGGFALLNIEKQNRSYSWIAFNLLVVQYKFVLPTVINHTIIGVELAFLSLKKRPPIYSLFHVLTLLCLIEWGVRIDKAITGLN